MFVDYEIFKGNRCGGLDVTRWDDGSYPQIANREGISICEKECNKHPECKAFQVSKHTRKCGYWMRGPLELTEDNTKDKNCHVKKQGQLSY